MQLSIAYNNTDFRPMDVDSMDTLAETILKNNYSTIVFKDNYRHRRNFVNADMMGLDFDGGLSLEDAKTRFAKYKHIIAATRNHGLAKGDQPPCDRFRVILFFEKPINDPRVYSKIYERFLKLNPEADKACKDPARMFYASSKVLSINYNGEMVGIDSTISTEAPAASMEEARSLDVDFSKKPAGWSNCKWAIANGFFGPGQSNQMMQVLASTYRSLNYSAEQAYHLCLNAMQLRKKRIGRDYDKVEIWKVVKYFYSDDYMGAVYNCKKEGSLLQEYCQSLGQDACSHGGTSFTFRPIKEIYELEEKIDWVVDSLLSKGGISLLAGPPKAGKSTIVRQLALTVARGGEFLNRKCKQGSVLYLALEEQLGLLKEQYSRLGLRPDDQIFIHIGPVGGLDKNAQLRQHLIEMRPALLIVDTMVKFLGIEDLNNYQEVYKKLEEFSNIARETSTHIMFIHHTNKSERSGPESIMGSVGIHGSVDNAIIFSKFGQNRTITTSQRGGVPFYKQPLAFDAPTETYVLTSGGTGEF